MKPWIRGSAFAFVTSQAITIPAEEDRERVFGRRIEEEDDGEQNVWFSLEPLEGRV
jgi:hypothetical protein